MKKNSTVLILGSTGLLGTSLTPALIKSGYSVTTHSKNFNTDATFDLINGELTYQFLDNIKPDVIINLIALTSVEACEQNIQSAYLINVKTVENIVKWQRLTGSNAHLIQISTDHIYDGVGPHDEENVTITNNYALTKYAGELAAILMPCTVLRTNFVGRSHLKAKESMTDWVFNSLTLKQNIQVMSDVMFSPLSMNNLIKYIQLVIEKKPLGIFNLGSNEGMSKADFDYLFVEKVGLSTKGMTPTPCSGMPFLKAYRPKDMRMNSSKFENLFDVTLPTLASEIDNLVKEYAN